MKVDETLQLAIKYHQAGDLLQAEHFYKETLIIQPDNSYALQYLGVLYYQLNNYDLAITYIQKALQINPEDSQAYYNLGIVFQEKGDNYQAMTCFQKTLLYNPANADAYVNLGIVLKEKENFDEAIVCFQKALRLNPNLIAAYYNLGYIFQLKNLFEEAITYYKKVLQLNPDLIAAHYNLGYIFHSKNCLSEAISHYQRVIQLNPELIDAYYNLGIIFQERKQFDDALTYYKKALSMDPNSVDSLNNLGVLFQQTGRIDEAIVCYQKAIHINPNFPDAYNNLGNIFQEKRQFDDSIAYYRKAIQLNPVYPAAYNNLANALQEKGQLEEAIVLHQKAIQFNPNFPEAYNNLGDALQEKGRLDEAIALYQKAIQLNPDYAEAYSNLGTVYQEKGQFDEAMMYHQKALQISPILSDAHWNISLTLLFYGNFEEGWKKYDWRFLKKDTRPSVFPKPLWDGRPLDGKSIIVSAEQGVGDEIMFASCLPEITGQSELCIIECDKRLIPLFSRSFPKAMVIGRLDIGAPYPEHLPPADMRIPVGSLPKFFRNSLSSFPQQQAYLKPDEQKVELWRERFSELDSGMKIGISWRGGSKTAVKLVRSTTLEQWKGLFSVQGVNFVNLQYGDCANELREAKKKLGITIHDWQDADPLKDLDGFAAQIAALDLVISVDNATVHMAGALGVPVWALLPFSCDWRWMREFEDTPWYKTVRLIRQKTFGQWDTVFEQVTSDLRQYLSTWVIPQMQCSYKSSITDDATVHKTFPPVPSDRTYRCAVITPVGPGHGHLYTDCLASIQKSFAENKGRFSEIIPIRIDDLEGKLGRSRARNLGIKQAAEHNADWIFFLDADDVMSPSVFEYVSPYLDEYDGIWGSIWSIEHGESIPKERPQQLPFLYSIDDVLSCDPFVTLQMGHFVRTSVALATQFNEAIDTGEDFDYYLRVWEKYRCIKIPLPLFYNRRGVHSTGLRSATGHQWRQQVDKIIDLYKQKL